jgi:hypothetical protein
MVRKGLQKGDEREGFGKDGKGDQSYFLNFDQFILQGE